MKTTPMHALTLYLLMTIATSGCFAQAKSKEQVIEFPFEFHHNEIILQVSVDGKGPFNMMLDTGTDPSAVDLTIAKQIGLKLHSLGKEITGGGTDTKLVYYRSFRSLKSEVSP